MKFVTKKAEKRQQEQTQRQIVSAANYGYSVGYDTAMTMVYVTIGSAIISAMIANTIADQSYKRSIMKLAKTNFNIDKTIVHMSNKMVDITNCGNGDKGFKKFSKFLFECDRTGFEFWNPDVSKMALNIGFDNFRDRISEMSIIVGKLDGKGSKTIKDAFKDWRMYGSNIFPYGSATTWKELLVKDYEFNAKLEQIRVILNDIKSGNAKDGDVDSLNTLLGFVESEYSGAASQMAAQRTENCAAYRNGEHFKNLIEKFLKETIEAFGIPFKENGKCLRIKRIDASTVKVIKSARVKKMKRAPLDFLPHRGSRTLEPPKQADDSDEEESSGKSMKKSSKKKKASQKDEDLDGDFDDDFDDDFFDEDEEDEPDDDDFDEENDFKEVITPKKSKKPVKKAPMRKKPEPEQPEESEDDESEDEDDFDVDETEDLDESSDEREVIIKVDDAEKDGPVVKKAHQNIINTVKQLHMKQSTAKRNRLKQQLHSQVTSFMSKYNVTKEDLYEITPGLKEVF